MCDRVREQHQRAGHRHRAERVIAPPGGVDACLGHDAPDQQQRDHADRDVQQEDVLPSGEPRQETAEDEPRGRAEGGEGAPDAERLVALGALGEHVSHGRQRGWEEHRGAEALGHAHPDQDRLAAGQRGSQRSGREHSETGEDHAAAPEQIGGPATEQQKNAVRQLVCSHDPQQARLREAELSPDRGQGRVDDRQVHDCHERGNGK